MLLDAPADIGLDAPARARTMKRVARTVRTRWRTLFLVIGAVLTVLGVVLASSAVLLPGILLLLFALLHGIGSSGCTSADLLAGWPRHGQTASTWPLLLGLTEQPVMPHRTPLDQEDLERELHAAGVSPEKIEAGARQLLALARGHQLAETRTQLGLGQKQIAAAMGVSIARVSQIGHGEVTSFVIARYVEALGGRLDLVADFGGRTVRLPVSDTATAA